MPISETVKSAFSIKIAKITQTGIGKSRFTCVVGKPRCYICLVHAFLNLHSFTCNHEIAFFHLQSRACILSIAILNVHSFECNLERIRLERAILNAKAIFGGSGAAKAIFGGAGGNWLGMLKGNRFPQPGWGNRPE